MPMAMFTLLDGLDLSGKAVYPFCTHEGSGLGRSEQDIRALCPGADVRPGLAVRGGSAASAGQDIRLWLNLG